MKIKKRRPSLLLLGIFLGIAAWTPSFFVSSVSAQSEQDYVSEQEVCKDYNGNRKDACAYGYNQGRTNPEKRKPAEVCETYKNAANKDACIKGYKEATKSQPQCGNTDSAIRTKFDFGCIGGDPNSPRNLSPIMDLLYSLIRFLSAGVGVVIVISIIMAGIQYSSSEGNPEATQQSKTRIRNALMGLIIYIFAFSLVQYLVPGGLFR